MRFNHRLSTLILLSTPFLLASIQTKAAELQLINPCADGYKLETAEIEIDQISIEVVAQCSKPRDEHASIATQISGTKRHPLTFLAPIHSPMVLEKAPRGLYREDMQLSITQHSSSKKLVLDLIEDFGERCATLTINTADTESAGESLLDRIKGLAWQLDSSCAILGIQAGNTIAVLPTTADIQFTLGNIEVSLETNKQRLPYKIAHTKIKPLSPIRKQGDVDIFRPCGQTRTPPSFDIHLLPSMLRIAALCPRNIEDTPVFSAVNHYTNVDKVQPLRSPFTYRQLKQDWRVTHAFNKASIFDTQILHNQTGSECIRIDIRPTRPAPYPKRFEISGQQLLNPVLVMFDKNCDVVAVQVLDQLAVFNTAKDLHFSLYGLQFEVKATLSGVK